MGVACILYRYTVPARATIAHYPCNNSCFILLSIYDAVHSIECIASRYSVCYQVSNHIGYKNLLFYMVIIMTSKKLSKTDILKQADNMPALIGGLTFNDDNTALTAVCTLNTSYSGKFRDALHEFSVATIIAAIGVHRTGNVQYIENLLKDVPSRASVTSVLNWLKDQAKCITGYSLKKGKFYTKERIQVPDILESEEKEIVELRGVILSFKQDHFTKPEPAKDSLAMLKNQLKAQVKLHLTGREKIDKPMTRQQVLDLAKHCIIIGAITEEDFSKYWNSQADKVNAPSLPANDEPLLSESDLEQVEVA